MNCIFTKQDDRLVCTQCGFSMRYREGNVLRNCPVSSSPAEKLELPSLPQQAAHFVGDMIEWAASGFATVEQSEKDRRLAICQGCEKYTGTRCGECGCQCSWASWLETKDCPLGKWSKNDAS